MGIGTSVALLAIGGILAFALNVSVGGVNIDVIGYILMAAGAIGLLFSALMRRRQTETVVHERPADREVVREEPAQREVVVERDADRHRDRG